ncbi:MAG: SDR family NAD(P)-dependent oxidoreductase [Acidobacteriota bacterium]
MARLSAKVVIITGASSGIGRATAIRAAADGARVVVSARREERLQDLVREIHSAGGSALAVRGDVTREADMHDLVRRGGAEFGRVDVMICNAGIGYHGRLDDTPDTAIRRLVDVNLVGTIYSARAALRVMRAQGHGHIIAISSIVGRRGVAGSSVYSATKAAQVAFIESLRAEFIGTGLHASVVFPVSTTTEFHDAIRRDFSQAVTGYGPRQSAETVADAIVRCILSPKAEVYPLRSSRWLALLAVIAPAQADRFVRRFGRRGTSLPEHVNDDALS